MNRDFAGKPADFTDWTHRRASEREWLFANGFNNGDPATNGEFAALKMLSAGRDVFLDVGANVGDFSKAFSETSPGTPIIAFEPNPALLKSIENACPGATRRNTALSDRSGEAVLHVRADQPGTASLTTRTRMNPRYRAAMVEVKVDLNTLDSVVAAHSLNCASPLLKIDVEGHEFAVMRGGEATLKAARQAAIMFEFSYGWAEAGEDLRECFYWLDERGFDTHRITPFGLEHVRFFTADMPFHAFANYVALKGIAPETLGAVETIATPTGETYVIRFDGG
jgi:FkbM family methyltransferase